MDFTHCFAVSAAGMTLERTRVEVAAMNLANANTLQAGNGPGFQPMQVVAQGGAPSFSEQVDSGLGTSEGFTQSLSLPSFTVQPSAVAPRRVYEPHNPFADAKGFVTYPGVDTASEMVTMMGALRSYEANVAAMNYARTLALKALEIGGGA